jgi:uncharacterized alkaline shock family protein YloU
MTALDIEAIATRVAVCNGVLELSAGVSGTVATYLPGRQIVGVRAHGERVEIHVVGAWDAVIPELASEIRKKVAALVDGRRVDVVVEDVGEPPP